MPGPEMHEEPKALTPEQKKEKIDKGIALVAKVEMKSLDKTDIIAVLGSKISRAFESQTKKQERTADMLQLRDLLGSLSIEDRAPVVAALVRKGYDTTLEFLMTKRGKSEDQAFWALAGGYGTALYLREYLMTNYKITFEEFDTHFNGAMREDLGLPYKEEGVQDAEDAATKGSH